MTERGKKDTPETAKREEASLGKDVRVVLVERKRSTYVSTANGRLP